MKKIFYLLFGILLVIPCAVNADVDIPGVVTHEAFVSSKDGIDIYTKEGNEYVKTGEKASYKTKYTVSEVYDNNYYCIDVPDCKSLLKYDDLTPSDYKLDESLLYEEVDAVVLKDVEIKKGPDKNYESTGVTIKAGENIKVRNIKNEYYVTPWFYVEYNGTKGYIAILDGSVIYSIRNEDVIFAYEASIIDPITKKELTKVLANAKANVVIGETSPWRDFDWNSKAFEMYYIECDGYKGFIDWNSVFIKEDEEKNYSLPYDVTVYKFYDGKKFSEELLSIPTGTDIPYTYEGFQTHMINYYEKDDVSGWILDLDCKKNDCKDYVSDKIVKEETKKEKDLTLYIFIGSSILLCLIAVILIMIINNKKRIS